MSVLQSSNNVSEMHKGKGSDRNVVIEEESVSRSRKRYAGKKNGIKSKTVSVSERGGFGKIESGDIERKNTNGAGQLNERHGVVRNEPEMKKPNNDVVIEHGRPIFLATRGMMCSFTKTI